VKSSLSVSRRRAGTTSCPLSGPSGADWIRLYFTSCPPFSLLDAAGIEFGLYTCAACGNKATTRFLRRGLSGSVIDVRKGVTNRASRTNPLFYSTNPIYPARPILLHPEGSLAFDSYMQCDFLPITGHKPRRGTFPPRASVADWAGLRWESKVDQNLPCPQRGCVSWYRAPWSWPRIPW
jgi:hypothetical protein